MPFSPELVEVTKGSRNGLVCKIRLVLLEQAAARLGVVALVDRVFQERLLQPIKCDYDTVDLGERVVEVALSIGRGQLSLLIQVDGRVKGRARNVGRRRIGQLPVVHGWWSKYL